MFEIEARQERMKIGIPHDQHAPPSSSARSHALLLHGKSSDVRSSARPGWAIGAHLLVRWRAAQKHLGLGYRRLVHEGRNTLMDRWKRFYAQRRQRRSQMSSPAPYFSRPLRPMC